MIEEWKDISERYEISNLGNVRSKGYTVIRDNGREYTANPKILKSVETSAGYKKVRIRTEKNKVFNLIIHRYVAKLFVDGYREDLQVNHIDGDKSNNTAKNLEWVTPKENIRHAWDNNLSTNEHTKKRVNVDGINYNSVNEAATKLGIDRNTVSKRCNNDMMPNYKWNDKLLNP